MIVNIQRTNAGVLESADTTHLTVESSTGSLIVNNVTVAPTSVGTYSYTVALPAGTYEATWMFVKAGLSDDIITRVFVADSPIQITKGVRLMDIEERLARRVGPYFKYKAEDTSGANSVVVKRLKTTVDVGQFDDLFILRRGIYWDDSQVLDFGEDDRVRTIASYDAVSGSLIPDRPYILAPQPQERIELHYLDPEQELRVAALEGIERCYFWDNVLVASTGALREIDLSSSLPWLDDRSSIVGVDYAIPSSIIPSSRVAWNREVSRKGVIKLQTDWVGPGSLYLDVLRSHKTLVNGEDSLIGPNDDFDILYVDLEYAARAGHVQAWVDFPDRMTPAAAQGLRLTATQAAAAFTVRSRNIMEQQPMFADKPRWETDEVLSQVGNAWGP